MEISCEFIRPGMEGTPARGVSCAGKACGGGNGGGAYVVAGTASELEPGAPDPDPEVKSADTLTGGWMDFVSLYCSRGGGGIDGGA